MSRVKVTCEIHDYSEPSKPNIRIHLKQVQKWWNIVYADEEMNQILAELESEGEE